MSILRILWVPLLVLVVLLILVGCGGDQGEPRREKRECVKSHHETQFVLVYGDGYKPALVEVCDEWRKVK